MLTRLTIHNYALINELEVDFAPGFSVITGETGAGKSIILGALQLLLGARADLRAVTDTSRTCRIEADFLIDGRQRTITRVLTPNGKSRAFIDDEPVTLAELKEQTDRFIDIHSQHQNLLLQTSDFQLSVVDTIAGNHSERQAYTNLYHEFTALNGRLNYLRDEADRQERERDFMQFQLDQLLSARIKPDEEAELENDVRTLSHAAETGEMLAAAGELLSDDERGAVAVLRMAAQQIQRAAELNPALEALAERASSAYIDIKDMAADVTAEAEGITIDPERLQRAEERLDVINTLLHKHHVADTAALLAIQDELDMRLNAINNIQDQIVDCETRLAQLSADLVSAARCLTQTRTAIRQQIIDGLHDTLASLGMPHARIGIECGQTDTPTPTGMDRVQFTIAANQGSPINTLASLSGGEAARVMLAIKSLLTGAVQLPTIIFDEIDTGVSGRIAEAMGRIMQAMGRADRQVISITHLPQIAACGANHYRVYKQTDGEQTRTHIQQLTTGERVREIATMLSGENLTPAAIQNAQALLVAQAS